jgi:hypothetical protein
MLWTRFVRWNACVAVFVAVAFRCLDVYNTGKVHYAEMFHFYKHLFDQALTDDNIIHSAASAVLCHGGHWDQPEGVSLEAFVQVCLTIGLRHKYCAFH